MDPAAKKRRLEDLMGGGPGVAGPSAPPSAPGPSSAPAAPSRDAYVVNANEAVSFRLVSSPAELEAAPCFNPEFTHQVFREDETIFGYLDLEVTITLHALTFHALVEIKHGGTAPSVLGPPDKVEARLREAFPAGFSTDRAAFCDTLTQLGPSPALPSDCVDVGVEGAPCSDARVLLLRLTSPEARAWHARLAPLVLFFIDAGTHLNTEKDDKWELLVALLPGTGGSGTHVVAGFATLYRFYAFPEGTRLRLSQVLVLHPMQRRGVASTLLQAVRRVAVTSSAVDYTVEDPTDALQKLREVSDLRAARGVPAVADAARAAVAGAQSAASLEARRASLECPPAVALQLKELLRLCKPQMRVVWEALLFLAARDARADPSSPAATAFRESVERRLRGAPSDVSTAMEVPRKFVLDLEDDETWESKGLEEDKLALYFVMAKGQPSGQGRAKPAAVLDDSVQEQQKAALDEAYAAELARLTALAMAVLK